MENKEINKEKENKEKDQFIKVIVIIVGIIALCVFSNYVYRQIKIHEENQKWYRLIGNGDAKRGKALWDAGKDQWDPPQFW